MFNGMVQKPATKAHLANLSPLQSGPASRSQLQQLGEDPSPPTPTNWAAARRHSSFLHHSWDDSIPLSRDSFFLEFLNISLPSNVFFFFIKLLAAYI